MKNVHGTPKSHKWKVTGWVKTYSKKSTFFFDSHAVESGSFVNGVVFADRGVFWKVTADLVNFFYIIADLTKMIFSKHTFTPPYRHSFHHIHRWVKFSGLIRFIWQSYGPMYGKYSYRVKVAKVKSGRLGQNLFQKEYFFFWFPCSRLWFVREWCCFRRSWGILKSYGGSSEKILYIRLFDLKDILKVYFYPIISIFFSSHSSVSKNFSAYLLHFVKLWAHIWKMSTTRPNHTQITQVKSGRMGRNLFQKEYFFFWFASIQLQFVREWHCFRRSWGILKSYGESSELFLYNRLFDQKDILKTYFYPTISTFFSSHSSVNKIFRPYLLHLDKLSPYHSMSKEGLFHAYFTPPSCTYLTTKTTSPHQTKFIWGRTDISTTHIWKVITIKKINLFKGRVLAIFTVKGYPQSQKAYRPPKSQSWPQWPRKFPLILTQPLSLSPFLTEILTLRDWPEWPETQAWLGHRPPCPPLTHIPKH